MPQSFRTRHYCRVPPLPAKVKANVGLAILLKTAFCQQKIDEFIETFQIHLLPSWNRHPLGRIITASWSQLTQRKVVERPQSPGCTALALRTFCDLKIRNRVFFFKGDEV